MSALSFLRAQLFQHIPVPNADLVGRTYIITGANTGLGLDCVKHLIRLNAARVIVTCRTEAKAATTKSQLSKYAEGNGNETVQIDTRTLEMNDYQSVLGFLDYCKTIDRIDGLILNAGVLLYDYQLAEDNEQTLTVNVISTFLLAIGLLPTLKNININNPAVEPHITVVGSIVHFWAKHKQLTSPKDGEIFLSLNDKKKADMGDRYNLSKLLVLLLVRELAKRSASTPGKVIINNPAPGLCHTDFFRNHGFAVRMMLNLLARSSEEGSRALVLAVTSDEETSGQYLSEGEMKPISSWINTPEGHQAQERVWKEVVQKLEAIRNGIAKNYQ